MSVVVLRADMGNVEVLVHPVKETGRTFVVIGRMYDSNDPAIQRLVEYVKDTRPTKSSIMTLGKTKLLELTDDEAMRFLQKRLEKNGAERRQGDAIRL